MTAPRSYRARPATANPWRVTPVARSRGAIGPIARAVLSAREEPQIQGFRGLGGQARAVLNGGPMTIPVDPPQAIPVDPPQS